MAQTIKPNFKLLLRRNTKSNWEKRNPILLEGEPGFEIDTYHLKIGDGKTYWNDLPYLNDNKAEIKNEITEILTYYGIENFKTKDDLNNAKNKNENKIYKVSGEKSLYQWNEDTQSFELLNGGGESFDPSTIKFINGGNANG